MWLVLTHSCVIPGYGGDTDGLWDRNWHPAPGRRTDTSGSRPSQHQPRLALAGKMKSERKKLDPSSVTTYISHNLVPKAFPSNLWRKNPKNEITYRKLGFFSPLINTDAFCRRSKGIWRQPSSVRWAETQEMRSAGTYLIQRMSLCFLRALWLVHLVGRILLYGTLKFTAIFVAQMCRYLSPSVPNS